MAEVRFRPVRQLSEYKGKGTSASREQVTLTDHDENSKRKIAPANSLANYAYAANKYTFLIEY